MCGIFAVIENSSSSSSSSSSFDTSSLKTRGPDSNNQQVIHYKNKNITLEHYRLKINGSDLEQPIYNSEFDIMLIVNGEIFNYLELERELNYKIKYSDCEILIPLYDKYRYNLNEFFNKINGQYSFVLLDFKFNKLFVSRDHVGVTSLYYGYNKSQLAFCSMIEPIKNMKVVHHFKPGTYFYTNINEPILREYTYNSFVNSCSVFTNQERILKDLNVLLTKSVESRLNLTDDVEYGFLLSGGLDSSLIASIASRYLNKKIKTFSIGLNENSIDLIYANQVAEFLDTEHYNFYMTPQEIEENVENVVKVIETSDTTTVRASTAMYLLIKKIKEQFPNLKVLYSGELSDELFCYLYGSNAPSLDVFQKETEILVSNVYMFDCLRADKTSMAHGVEIRVPFSDIQFMKYVLSIDPELKCFGNLSANNSIEKNLLRLAFSDNYLPDSVLYRKKEQFSDGVSPIGENEDTLISILQNYAKKNAFKSEKLFYTYLYEKHLGKKNYNINITGWEPKWSDIRDPSGRLQSFWVEK
jgi:asparagine synthase (glutamine-hydrolysing)